MTRAEFSRIMGAMEPTERILYVQILAQMLIADGVLEDEERSYLDRIMDSLGMEAAERRSALGGVSIDSPVEERVEQLGAEARATLLREVEKALGAASEVSRAEAYFLERVKTLLS